VSAAFSFNCEGSTRVLEFQSTLQTSQVLPSAQRKHTGVNGALPGEHPALESARAAPGSQSYLRIELPTFNVQHPKSNHWAGSSQAPAK
jgi:hypothetical protein